jgi:hypothetical protein
MYPEPCQYGVRGRLLLHDGYSLVTGRMVNPMAVDVHEVVRAQWAENAPWAAALKIERRHSRCCSAWVGQPHIWHYVEPHQEPPDRALRDMGAPTLPGMD